ncbi:hypothetical protein C8R45DRAFT_1090258 [Mycena sanguinolenta]|nr:hypothetical protein C8R45DRAFT_1090258 [Mycena sanguinolenta]
MAPKATQPKASSKKGKVKVNFGANGTLRKRNLGPPLILTLPAQQRGLARTDHRHGSCSVGQHVGKRAKKRVRNRWGIRPTEVPENAKLTQRAFQHFIRAISGMLTQTDVLPTAIETQKHYDRRFDNVNDVREHMRTLVDESRTAVSTAKDLATKLKRDAVRISGPIANDIACNPETRLASIFTMILKAGLRGFCSDLEGPIQSKYNQLHRHLAVSGFQFLSASLALGALEINAKAEDTELLGNMYDNYVYGTLAQKTKMERCRRAGSVGQSPF